jgi:two-component system chemotaxis response regulator CheY
MGNVLIVDDSSLIRSVASKATEDIGHIPIVAINGEDGLKKLAENEIDLIFSDVNMPVMNGMDMVKKIKEQDKYKFIPIVMLTTEDGDKIKSEGKTLGVKAWMVKPFNDKKFGMAVKKLLG